MSRIDDTREFIPVRIAVLTVSDSRDLSQDRSGAVLVERIEAAGHILADRMVVRDERDQITEQLREWIANPEIDVVLSTGGTGLTGRDVTVEAHRDVYEKEIDAFGTVFTIVSMKRSAPPPCSPAPRGRGERHLPFRPARQPRCLQGRMGRNPVLPIRLPPQPLQFCRNNAAPGRTFATEVIFGRVSAP